MGEHNVGYFAQEVEDMGKKAGEAGEGMKVLGHGAHDAHAAIHALGAAFPGVQQMARFLPTGFTAAIGVALIAYEYLNKQIEQFSEALDRLSTGPGARGEWAQKIKEEAEQSAVAFNVWEHNIDRIIAAEQTLAQATDRALAADREKANSAAAIATAQKELAEPRWTWPTEPRPNDPGAGHQNQARH